MSSACAIGHLVVFAAFAALGLYQPVAFCGASVLAVLVGSCGDPLVNLIAL